MKEMSARLQYCLSTCYIYHRYTNAYVHKCGFQGEINACSRNIARQPVDKLSCTNIKLYLFINRNNGQYIYIYMCSYTQLHEHATAIQNRRSRTTQVITQHGGNHAASRQSLSTQSITLHAGNHAARRQAVCALHNTRL